MSIKRIGNGCQSGKPLVLLDLTEPERDALARVLALAEVHLAEIPFPAVRSRRQEAELMVATMRLALDLPEVKAPAAEGQAKS